MADKIKSFFQKKVRDEKFKNAGRGHRLNEPSVPAASQSRGANIPKRLEPTHEAKTAGQAALARFEEKKTNAPKFNTSYAAIQMRVKRELEQERRLAAANQETETSTSTPSHSGSRKPADEPVKDPEALAVSGVYYRCPMVSDEVLDKETWFKKIKEFLSSQLSTEESGLAACLVIRSCNEGEKRIQTCVDTICKYLENIQNDPTEMKYWKIRMSNKVFEEKVKPLEGAIDLLTAAGFVPEKLPNNGMEDFLVWNPDISSVEHLAMLVDALKSAEPITLELDRNMQVLLPSQAALKSELPNEFYALSTEDLVRLQAERMKAAELNQTLMTQAMRQKLAQAAKSSRRYQFTLIRIRFPDNIILQGTFAVEEKYENVIEFISQNLTTSEIPFSLTTASREKLTEESFSKTLLELQLVPAVVLLFSWNTANITSEIIPSQYLKEETLSYVQSM